MPRRLAVTALIALLPLLASCGGSSSNAAPIGSASGNLRFLLSSEDGLSQMVVGGQSRSVIKWTDQAYPLDPVISPDGKSIAYGLQTPAKKLPDGDVDFGSDLYVARIDGKDQRLLLAHKQIAEFIRTPAWVSNTELLYTIRGRSDAGRADFRIERMDIASGKSSRFIDWGVDPAISKDRQKVVWDQIDPDSQRETLTVAGLDLNDKTALVTPTSKLALFTSQVFSPDGKQVAFAAVDISSISPGGRLPGPGGGAAVAAHPFAQDVWLVNTDGTGLRRLAEIAENMPSISWSGDGRTIYALGPSALWKIDPVSGKSDQIGQGIVLGQIVWLSGS